MNYKVCISYYGLSNFWGRVIDESPELFVLSGGEVFVIRIAEEVGQIKKVFFLDNFPGIGIVLEVHVSLWVDSLLDSADHVWFDVRLLKTFDVGHNALFNMVVLVMQIFYREVKNGFSVAISIKVHEINVIFTFPRTDHHFHDVLQISFPN